MTKRVAALAAGLVFCLVACTDQPHERGGQADERGVPAELRCEESDAVAPPPDGQRLADGVVVAGAYAPVRSGRSDGLLFAKGGLWLEGPSSVRLSVAGPDSALVAWGKPGQPTRQLAAPACAGAGWRVWPGGFYVAERTCVRLLVEIGQASVQAAVPVGAPCG